MTGRGSSGAPTRTWRSRRAERVSRVLQPGEEVTYTVTYLEMTERPRTPPPPRPANLNTALLSALNPPVEYFLYLYSTVGAAHEWTDWLDRPREAAQYFVSQQGVSLYTLILDGYPGGFFMLDASEPELCDLAYFGLVPQAVGKGLGRWFLATAVETGWGLPGVARMTVNTNTLDHPRALGLYQRVGFQPVRQEEQRRILTRERALPE